MARLSPTVISLCFKITCACLYHNTSYSPLLLLIYLLEPVAGLKWFKGTDHHLLVFVSLIPGTYPSNNKVEWMKNFWLFQIHDLEGHLRVIYLLCFSFFWFHCSTFYKLIQSVMLYGITCVQLLKNNLFDTPLFF